MLLLVLLKLRRRFGKPTSDQAIVVSGESIEPEEYERRSLLEIATCKCISMRKKSGMFTDLAHPTPITGSMTDQKWPVMALEKKRWAWWGEQLDKQLVIKSPVECRLGSGTRHDHCPPIELIKPMKSPTPRFGSRASRRLTRDCTCARACACKLRPCSSLPLPCILPSSRFLERASFGKADSQNHCNTSDTLLTCS